MLPAVVERGVKVIANAGGVNPRACADALLALADQKGVRGKLALGVVTGDDLLPRLDELLESGHGLANMDTGEPLSVVRDRVLSANAYIGSGPIVEALAQGANIVITGRSTDTALTMAPLRYEFGWGAHDWDKLAAGIIAGHILECGAQSSGRQLPQGLGDDPRRRGTSATRSSMPVPTAASRSASIPDTGGRIDVPTITEQLVYEMGDPHAYITPDVVADFTIDPSRAGRRRTGCASSGSLAAPPPTSSRCRSPIAPDSRRSARSSTRGPTRWRRRRLADRVLRRRLEMLGLHFDTIVTEYVGANATHGPLAGERTDAPEVQLRVGVRGQDRAMVERFTRELIPMVLNGPPSVTGFAAGRPKVEEIVAYWPALVDKTVVTPQRGGGPMKVRLLDLAHTRSGDKGDTANVGVIALKPEWYPLLARELTVERVKQHFTGRDHRRRRSLRAPQPAGAQLPPARRARRRRDALAQDRRAGEGLLDGDAADGARPSGRRGVGALASGRPLSLDACPRSPRSSSG